MTIFSQWLQLLMHEKLVACSLQLQEEEGAVGLAVYQRQSLPPLPLLHLRLWLWLMVLVWREVVVQA
jgi:hypothetical protein